MLTVRRPNLDLIHCSVQSLMFDPLTVGHNIDYPKENPISADRVVGSCNGLICVANTVDVTDMFLWNPTTRTSKKLPPVAVNLRGGCVWGFGYDESNDDYNVVGVCCMGVEIYSLRANSWKSIEGFESGVLLDVPVNFHCGEIHFPVTSPWLGFNWDIVSLDLRTEDYGKVDQPDYEEGYFNLYLGVLGGCICVLCTYKVRADVWVMKEYGVKESWTRVSAVPYDDPRVFLCSTPLCILENGEMLLALGTVLVVYNPRDNCYRYPETMNIGPILKAVMFVESFVSV